MRTVKMFSTVILAVVALSAIASATASAALPEFNPGSTGTKFTGTSGAGTLSTAAKATLIECTSDEVKGELTGAKKQGTAKIDFKGCKSFGIVGTKSLGDAEGVILVEALLELCYINKANKEVGVLTEVPSSKPVHVEVAGKLLIILGDAVGVLKAAAVEPTTKYTITYKQKGGKQEPAGCEGKTENLLVQENETGAFENAGEATTENTEFAIAQSLLA
jgi:hypothetical protein